MFIATILKKNMVEKSIRAKNAHIATAAVTMTKRAKSLSKVIKLNSSMVLEILKIMIIQITMPPILIKRII